MNNKLCIEFGSNSIRFAKGKFRHEFLIDSFFTLSLEGETLIDSAYDEYFLGEMIKNELKARGIRDRGVTFIISAMPNMLVREINIPPASIKDTYGMVKQEAGSHFPINLDNYVIDFRVVGIFEEDGVKKQKVIVIAVPKFLIERLIDIANAADLRLEKIDVEANTLSKLLFEYQQQEYTVSNRPSLICAVQDTYLTMVIVKKGVIQMSKTSSYESVEAALDTAQESYNQAASTREIGSEASEGEYNVAERRIIGEIADNIARYLSFYTSKHREDMETVYITGEVGEKLDIGSAVRSRFEVKAKTIDDLKVVITNREYKGRDVSEYKNVFGGLLR
ncbi:MAG: pilus assembly protein PilM [Clostridium sp.]